MATPRVHTNQQGRNTYPSRGVQSGRGFDGGHGFDGARGGLGPARHLSGRAPQYGRERNRLSESVHRIMARVPTLLPILYRKSNGLRTVVVTGGFVSEIIPKWAVAGDDCVIEHPVTNIWEGSLLKEHGIKGNEIVGIAFSTDVNGFITGECTVSVRTVDGAKTTHYTPPVADDPGAAGQHFAALAQLVGSGDSDRLIMRLGGSGVEYVHDTPSFLKNYGATPGKEADGEHIFTKYNLERGLYEYKGLKGISPILIEEVYGTLEFSLEESSETDPLFNHDLYVYGLEIVAGSPTTVYIDIPSLTVTGTTGEGEGGHGHSVTITGTIPALSTTASTTGSTSAGTPAFSGSLSIASSGAHAHTVTGTVDSGGEHSHALELHKHDVELYVYGDAGSAFDGETNEGYLPGYSEHLNRTGSYVDPDWVDDGEHDHTFSSGSAGSTGSEHTHPIDTSLLTMSALGTHDHSIPALSTAESAITSGEASFSGSDGTHDHSVSGSTAAVTGEDRQAIEIPGLPVLQATSTYILYCYRLGSLVGVYPDGNGAPALPAGGTESSFCAFESQMVKR